MEKRAYDGFRLRKIYNLVSVPFVNLSLAQTHLKIKYFRMKFIKSFDVGFIRIFLPKQQVGIKYTETFLLN